MVDCAIDGDIRQFSAGFGQSFEPGPREPVWDVFHLGRLSAGCHRDPEFGNKHIGNVSTRNAPGSTARPMRSTIRSAACKNLSSWDLMSIP